MKEIIKRILMFSLCLCLVGSFTYVEDLFAKNNEKKVKEDRRKDRVENRKNERKKDRSKKKKRKKRKKPRPGDPSGNELSVVGMGVASLVVLSAGAVAINRRKKIVKPD